jgi:homoserine kinase
MANLGPGFDVLALAVNRYVTVSVTAAPRLCVLSSGCGAELPAGPDHLAARVATEVAGTDALEVVIHSEIPVARGLGSSAAVAVAAAAAAGASDPLAWGARLDGHPENAAASVLGGLVAAADLDGVATARRLPLDRRIRLVALVPDRPLPTAEARAALPSSLAHEHAAFNLGRMGLLLAGLGDLDQLVPAAGDDRLHQDARAGLFPEADALLDGLRRCGALTSFWSGAGPTLVGVTTEAHEADLAASAASLLARHGVDGEVLRLAPDTLGVRVG